MQEEAIASGQTLSVLDAVALIMGVVIGAGIFSTPSLFAANRGNNGMFFMAWLPVRAQFVSFLIAISGNVLAEGGLFEGVHKWAAAVRGQ
ncbi:MAG TPA: hypothetical protein VJZ49_14695 [Syntrophales bacterium]|nr:hypothetical protein [Syntrophales bacterium]